MKRSIPQLEKLSDSLYSHITHYKFTKDEHLTEKYRKGRVNAANWLNDLIFYYMQKEANLMDEFKEQIQNQKKELADIEDGDFKQGLFDELNIVEDIVGGNKK